MALILKGHSGLQASRSSRRPSAVASVHRGVVALSRAPFSGTPTSVQRTRIAARDPAVVEFENEDADVGIESIAGEVMPEEGLLIIEKNPELYPDSVAEFVEDGVQTKEDLVDLDSYADEEGEYDDFDLGEGEGEGEEAVDASLEAARDKRDEALNLLKSWTPGMLAELYPEGQVPGFSKQQSEDLWRSLRYFLAVEAIDASYEVQNLSGVSEDYVEFEDDDDLGDEDLEEDSAEDAALYEEYDAAVQEVDISFKSGDKIYGTISRVDEDGAYADIGGKGQGFIPMDECSYAKLQSPGEVLTVGAKREFVVVESDDGPFGEVILSLREVEKGSLWARLKQLQEEDITVYATVLAASPGGLFCEYESIKAFLPGTQYSMKLAAENLEELVGYQVACKIYEADEERERIILSNRKASGDVDVQGYKVGDVVSGVVQSVKPYGAFIDLGGVTGLLHISQVSHDRVNSMEKILNEGDKIKVMVLSMDKERGRVTLSTKKLEPTPGDFLRDPQLVFTKAEEMAEMFRSRVNTQSLGEGEGNFMPSMDENYDIPAGDYPEYPMMAGTPTYGAWPAATAPLGTEDPADPAAQQLPPQ